MDWTNLPSLITEAAAIVLAIGASVAAAVEIIKLCIENLSEYEVPAEAMSIASAILSAVICALIMVQSGTPWLLALLATISAMFAPKAAHDLLSAAKVQMQAKSCASHTTRKPRGGFAEPPSVRLRPER